MSVKYVQENSYSAYTPYSVYKPGISVHYSIYRVFGASSDRLRNFGHALQTRKAGLFVHVLQIVHCNENILNWEHELVHVTDLRSNRFCTFPPLLLLMY